MINFKNASLLLSDLVVLSLALIVTDKLLNSSTEYIWLLWLPLVGVFSIIHLLFDLLGVNDV